MGQKPEMILKELNKASEQINKLQKNGIEIPEEVLSALSQLKNLVAAAKDSNSQVSADELNNLAKILRDGLSKLGQAGQLPKVFNDANNQINKLKKALEIDKKKALKANLDVSKEQNQLEGSINELEKVLFGIKSNAEQNPQTALEKLRTDFYSQLDNVWSMEMKLQLLINPKNFSSLISKDLKQAYKQVNELKKQNVDITDLENLLDQAQNQLNSFRDSLKTEKIVSETLITVGKELVDTKQKIFDQLENLRKKYNFEPPQINNQPQLFPSKDFKSEE
jgi:heterodisulfide reductase subunit C